MGDPKTSRNSIKKGIAPEHSRRAMEMPKSVLEMSSIAMEKSKPPHHRRHAPEIHESVPEASKTLIANNGTHNSAAPQRAAVGIRLPILGSFACCCVARSGELPPQ